MANEYLLERVDNYTSGGFDFTAAVLVQDYKQGDYARFRELYSGDNSVGIILGSALVKPIVDYWSAFEFGLLPTVVVTNPAGKADEKASIFANRFLKEQQFNLLKAIHAKNLYGDVYLAFNLDRNVEAIIPDSLDPGFAPYTESIITAKTITNRFVRNPDTGRKVKIQIIRTYDNQNITYEAKLESTTKYGGSINIPPSVKFPNPLGVCPILHLPNAQVAGFTFGWPDFYYTIPYLSLWHKTLKAAFEAQQYAGKPILAISGITSDVASWYMRTFQIDVSKPGTEQDSKLMDFFKRHKMLALADAADIKFVEARDPTGQSEELLKRTLSTIAIISGIPEFMFGALGAGSEAYVREQYTGLKAKLLFKQIQLEKTLRELIRWAMVWYSAVTENPETGVPFEKIGIVTDLKAAVQYQIDLIWPDILGSDNRLKIEAMSALSNAGAVSRLGLLKNFPQYFPNPEAELAVIKSEMTEFQALAPQPVVAGANGNGAVGRVPQTSGAKASAARRNVDNTNNSNQGTADRTAPSRSKP